MCVVQALGLAWIEKRSQDDCKLFTLQCTQRSA
jgi:hypothetical protein